MGISINLEKWLFILSFPCKKRCPRSYMLSFIIYTNNLINFTINWRNNFFIFTNRILSFFILSDRVCTLFILIFIQYFLLAYYFFNHLFLNTFQIFPFLIIFYFKILSLVLRRKWSSNILLINGYYLTFIITHLAWTRLIVIYFQKWKPAYLLYFILIFHFYKCII